MRGGIDKGLCLLALLFVCNRAEDAVSSEDLKTGPPEEDSKSAALAQSSAYADSSEDDNVSDTSGAPTLSKNAAASASAFTNGGQASAQANAQSSLQDTLTRPGWSSPGKAGSSALAEAKAQASGGLSGPQPLPYQPGYDLGSHIYGPGNSYPLNVGGGSSSAQAKAEAQAVVNNAGGGLYPGLNYPKGTGVSSAQAQAEAQATNSGGYSPAPSLYPTPYQLGYQQPYQPVYPSQGSNAVAQAQAQAEALSPSGSNLGPNYPGYQYAPSLSPGSSSANALADAQAISGGYGNADANAHAVANAQSSATAGADAYSRVIARHEYIMPHLIPGAEDVIICRREGELYYFWSSAYQCMVCTCINEMGMLRPVCAKCDGCMSPIPGPVPGPVPAPTPLPDPEPYPVTLTPIPPPLPTVTCNPLPSGQPFQNPLNPCQICICRETVNWQGEPDVHIDCQQNPDCIIPPDVTTLPPTPDPVPVPLPICDKFPPNVIFPHPTDVCKVCKCIVEPLGLGVLEPRILCMTLPDCVPTPPFPTLPPEPITLPPLPTPVPFPPTPIPWPPVSTPAPYPDPPPGPGPLPGPSPHESCRPYAPNTPFQHPWDECQVCVCTEAYSYGRTSIEVNCFTKKSCCYEPPYPEPITFAPGPYITTPTITIIDKICEYRSFGVEFVNPVDQCLVCTCELQGNLVTSFCRRSQAPECIIIYPGGGSSSADAQASAIAQTGSVPSYYNPMVINGLPTGGQSQASAEANAIAQNSLQPGLQPQPVIQPWMHPGMQQIQPDLQPGYQYIIQPNPGQGGQYYQIPGFDLGQTEGGQTSASASALAEAQASQYQVPDYGSTSPFYNPLFPSQGSNLNGLNYLMNNPSSLAEAEASASANTMQYSPQQYLGNNLGTSQYQLPYYVSGNQLGGLGGTQLGGAGYNVPLISPSGYGQFGGGGIQGGGSSAVAEAEASANALSPGSYGLPGSNLGQGSSASAEAKANAQTLTVGGGGGGAMYPGGSPLAGYQNPYMKQGYQSASASSKAQASGSNAQSQASASANAGRTLGKSAQEDLESSEEEAVK